MDRDAVADLRTELSNQLIEQRQSLSDIDAAIAAEDSAELQQIRVDLLEAIRQLEEALNDIQSDTIEYGLGSSTDKARGAGVWERPAEPSACSERPTIGDSCRFRYTDGQWYYGLIDLIEQDAFQVRFAFPTRLFMLQAVKVPPGLVHLIPPEEAQTMPGLLPIGARVLARPHHSQLWEAAEVIAVHTKGSSATVVLVTGRQQVDLPWSHIAESSLVRDVDEAGCSQEMATAAGGGGWKAGVSERVGSQDPSPANSSDSSSSGSQESESEMSFSDDDGKEGGVEEDEEATAGLGSVMLHAWQAAQAGPQTESTHFADWEVHGRGIASKLMARMGHKKGHGLGKRGNGLVDPLEIAMQQSKQGLGGGRHHHHHKHKHRHRHGTSEGAVDKPKRSRGGERTRRKKHAAASRASREEHKDKQQQLELQTGCQGLFAFINQHIGDHSEAAGKLKEVGLGRKSEAQAAWANALWGDGTGAAAAAAADRTKKQEPRQCKELATGVNDRRTLLSKQDNIADIKERIKHLGAMMSRNKNDKVLAPQIAAKIRQAEVELKAAHADAARHTKALSQREAQKKWTKF